MFRIGWMLLFGVAGIFSQVTFADELGDDPIRASVGQIQLQGDAYLPCTFFVVGRTLLMTAYHCLLPENEIPSFQEWWISGTHAHLEELEIPQDKAWPREGELLRAERGREFRVARANAYHDWVLLRLVGRVFSESPLLRVEPYSGRESEANLTLVGFGQRGEDIWTRRTRTSFFASSGRFIGGAGYFRMEAPEINFGDSGAPILRCEGGEHYQGNLSDCAVVGVLSRLAVMCGAGSGACNRERTGVAWGVPSNAFIEAVRQELQ